MIKRPKIFFHVTPNRNLGRIKTMGLLPKLGRRSRELGEKDPKIFLFPTRENVESALWNWLGECFENTEVAILELAVSPDIPVKPSFEGKESWEWWTTNPIPPEAILSVERA